MLPVGLHGRPPTSVSEAQMASSLLVVDDDDGLRRKLEAGGEPRLLHTVRGAGYVLRDG